MGGHFGSRAKIASVFFLSDCAMLGHAVRRAAWSTTSVDSAANLLAFNMWANQAERSEVAAILCDICIVVHAPYEYVPLVCQGLDVIQYRFAWLHPSWAQAGSLPSLGGRTLPFPENQRQLAWKEIMLLVDTTQSLETFCPPFMQVLLDRPEDTLVPRRTLFYVWAHWHRARQGWVDPQFMEDRRGRLGSELLQCGSMLAVWYEQARAGLPMLPPCGWCGLPTGNFCEVCDGPICNGCEYEFAYCRRCCTAP